MIVLTDTRDWIASGRHPLTRDKPKGGNPGQEGSSLHLTTPVDRHRESEPFDPSLPDSSRTSVGQEGTVKSPREQ